jgi:lysophospholipase L1-like esterase
MSPPPAGALVSFAAAFFLLGAALGWGSHRWSGASWPREIGSFGKVRMKTIQAQLDQVYEPYIVVMGDSHAERMYLATLCGLPIVNAGIAGATAGDVLALAENVTPPRKAAALLLSVGTNDILAKRHPETDEAERNFKADLKALGDRLVAWSDRRALIAIPPVARKEEVNFPRVAAARYSAMLEHTCEQGDCTFLGLFAPLSPSEADATSSDGVHMRNYAQVFRAQEPALCASLGLPTAHAR